MKKIGIIGAGSWGSALAWHLYNNGNEITLWSALENEIQMLRETHEQKEKLPGVILPEDMEFTTDLEKTVAEKDVLVLAVPSPFTRSTAAKMSPFIRDGQKIVNVAKGIEETTLMTLSQIIEEEIPNADVAVLSGPSHAEEVGRGIPTTIVAGAKEKETAEYLQNLFMSKAFRVYISSDIMGMELGAALKNVVALAAGMADGLGYGDNTKAALITRGIAEIARLGIHMGGRIETFYGLTGIGDLIVTCASMHSRNRRAGILIGKGATMEEAMAQVKMVVEGVYSAKAGYSLSKKYGVSMPIIEQVNEILFKGKSASEAVSELMLRDKKVENIDLRQLYQNSVEIPW
ncbi:MAG: NAD(P)H-dependent glycerol-3-phosphate dehydrogenase [Clostridium sp.]|nr:NAD(P)H-dependent glycerol-3-phosphate dehydrogenase [Clostridium sp.]